MEDNIVHLPGGDDENEYGITVEHSKMPNGELRFRLKKNDGTAYIRTEASSKGAWQEGHYHNQVLETYIVQNGWIGYAEWVGNKPLFKIYEKDQKFTTTPFIIHNIYMPGDSVIHTVKHGNSKGELRLINEETIKFTELTSKISEEELKKQATRVISEYGTSTPEKDYNEAYRHFDNLIWQVPAWSSGIFTAILIGTGSLKDTDKITLVSVSGFNINTLLSIFYVFASFFILSLSYALYRFRWNQIRTKIYTPKFHLRSPQVLLQLVVNIQFIILLFLAGSIVKIGFWWVFSIAILIIAILTSYQEYILTKEGKKGNKPVTSRS
jgi:hypothetical protein